MSMFPQSVEEGRINNRQVNDIMARVAERLGGTTLCWIYSWFGPAQDWLQIEWMVERSPAETRAVLGFEMTCVGGRLKEVSGRPCHFLDREEQDLLTVAMREEWLLDYWDDHGRVDPKQFMEHYPGSCMKDNAERLQLLERMATAATFDRELQSMMA